MILFLNQHQQLCLEYCVSHFVVPVICGYEPLDEVSDVLFLSLEERVAVSFRDLVVSGGEGDIVFSHFLLDFTFLPWVGNLDGHSYGCVPNVGNDIFETHTYLLSETS